jgi:glycosyltransferase involved in cell wall biosynthesis
VFLIYQQFSCYILALREFKPAIYQHETYFCLMEEQIFVSICIPAYSRVQFLQRLLDSISLQSFSNFEVVITDDSPGNEVFELSKSHPLGSKIRYFKNPVSLGSPENWNEALRKSAGEWIKIMHDDDWFTHAGSLEEFVRNINNENVQFVFSSYTNVYPDGHKKHVHLNRFYVNRLMEKPELLFASNRIGPPSAVLFKKMDSVYFDQRMKWLVDIDFYIAYLKKYPGFVYIDRPLVQIGISQSQVTQISFGNPEIEIPERKLLFEKLGEKALRYLPVYDEWWRFIRNFKISDVRQLNPDRSLPTIPKPLASMVRFQNNIPMGMLKIGIFSKSLMFAHYLYSRLRF